MEEERAYASAVAAARTLLGTDIAAEVPLMSAGLDSIGATEFTRVLGESVGVALPSTLLFDHPTIESVAHFVQS